MDISSEDQIPKEEQPLAADHESEGLKSESPEAPTSAPAESGTKAASRAELVNPGEEHLDSPPMGQNGQNLVQKSDETLIEGPQHKERCITSVDPRETENSKSQEIQAKQLDVQKVDQTMSNAVAAKGAPPPVSTEKLRESAPLEQSRISPETNDDEIDVHPNEFVYMALFYSGASLLLETLTDMIIWENWIDEGPVSEAASPFIERMADADLRTRNIFDLKTMFGRQVSAENLKLCEVVCQLMREAIDPFIEKLKAHAEEKRGAEKWLDHYTSASIREYCIEEVTALGAAMIKVKALLEVMGKQIPDLEKLSWVKPERRN